MYNNILEVKMEINENFFKTPENNTVESFLNEDERILWRGRAKKSAYILGKSLSMAPFALIWLIFDSIFIFLMFFVADVPPSAYFFIIPFFAVHLMPVWRTIEYVITNKRIIEFRGEPKFIYTSINFERIVDVSLRVNFIDKILGVGDITIYSDGFLDFKAPDNFVYYHKMQRNSPNLQNCLIISDISDCINLHTKLLKICQNKDAEGVVFERPKIKCRNCATMYENTRSRCPSCGSPREEK